jgi:hypothetical protein
MRKTVIITTAAIAITTNMTHKDKVWQLLSQALGYKEI